MPRGRPLGQPYAQLNVSPAMLRVMIAEAGDNKSSPCQRGTLSEVARHADLSGHQLLGHLVTGRRHTCSPRSASGIAEALGVPFERIFTLKSSPLAGRPVKRDKVPA